MVILILSFERYHCFESIDESVRNFDCLFY